MRVRLEECDEDWRVWVRRSWADACSGICEAWAPGDGGHSGHPQAEGMGGGESACEGGEFERDGKVRRGTGPGCEGLGCRGSIARSRQGESRGKNRDRRVQSDCG